MTDRSSPQPTTARAAALLERTAGLARRFRWPVVAAMLALTALFGWFTATNLKMNADTAGMLSRKLDFRKRSAAYKAAFPHEGDNLAIVLDGPNPDLVEDGAARLATRLRAETRLFRSVFYAQGEPYFQKNGLLYLSEEELRALSGRLAEAQPLLGTLAKDPSLRGLFEVLGLAVEALRKGKTDANVAGLTLALDRIAAVVEARAAGRQATLSWRRLMSPTELKASDARRVIVVQPRLDQGSLQPGRKGMRRVRALARELGLTPATGVRVRLTGTVALNTEELKSVQTGASLAGLVSLGLVSVLLVLGLRSLRLVACILLTLVMGLIWTAAFATVAIGELNLISVAFAVLFIGLGVDFGIHVSLRYREEVDAGGPAGKRGDDAQAAALKRAARGVGVALALSAATTAAAFLSFVPTAYRGISELGIIAAFGLVVALVFSLTLLPALLSILPVRASAKGGGAGTAARLVNAAVARHAGAICLTAIVLGVLAVPFAALMRFDHNPLNLKDLGTESVQTVIELMREENASPYTASVLAPDRKAAAALAKRLKALREVDKAITIDDLVPKKQAEKLEIVDEIALFLASTVEDPETRAPPTPAGRKAALRKFRGELKALIASGKAGAIAPRIRRLAAALDRFAEKTGASDAALAALDRALVGTFPARIAALKAALGAKRVTAADLPAAIRNRRIAADGRIRVEIFPTHDLTDNRELRAFVTRIEAIAPGVTDAPVDMLKGGEVVVEAFYQATGTALIAIVLLLALLLRRAWDVALVLAPFLLAALLTLAAAYLAGLDFNLANIIVLPLLLGLSVDSGIHLVRRARAGAGETLLHTSTPRAVLFSALTTVGSFGSLALSGHRGTASMGLLLTIAIAMTLVCALVVLPAMMAWREGRGA